MTSTLRFAGLVLGKAQTDAGMTDGLLPVSMLHQVRGKKIVLTG